jgi:RES domain-containing protein
VTAVLAWRLCRAPYADLSGEGGRQYGGRWNTPGQPVVYTATDPALAVLEVRVHLDLPPGLLPDDFVLLGIEFRDMTIEEVTNIPGEPAAFGDAWLRERRTAVLRVPSIIVPESQNLLFNPAHPHATCAAIISSRPFSFDRRLWRSG